MCGCNTVQLTKDSIVFELPGGGSHFSSHGAVIRMAAFHI